MATHGGTTTPKGHLNRGTAQRPNPTHAGSGRPHGVTLAPKPQVYGPHGGTLLRRDLNKRSGSAPK
jgi:hypothetical protein